MEARSGDLGVGRGTRPGCRYNRPANDAVVGPPVLILDSEGCLQLFCVGESGAMWNLHQTSPAGAWSNWISLGIAAGTGFDDRPAISFSADGRMELFVRGREKGLWHASRGAFGRRRVVKLGVLRQCRRRLSGSSGHGPERGRTARSCSSRGLDGNLYHAWQTSASNGWHFWDNLGNGGPRLENGPAVAPSGDRRLEVFVLGADGALWQHLSDGRIERVVEELGFTQDILRPCFSCGRAP